MTEFRIELTFRDPPDRTWVSQVLFTAVAHGVRVNHGRYKGTYRVIPSDLDEMIVETEAGGLERTDMLAEAVEAYAAFDPDDTELGLTTTYTGCDTDIPCSIGIAPQQEGYILRMTTDQKDLRTERALSSFLALPTALFERFEFVYGASLVADQRPVPATRSGARADHPRRVTYYPSWLVAEIGRERFRTAPMATVQELSTGGLVLRVNADSNRDDREIALAGSITRREAVREHLVGESS